MAAVVECVKMWKGNVEKLEMPEHIFSRHFQIVILRT